MATKNGHRYTADEIMGQLIQNAQSSLVSRSRLASALADPRRSIDDECGYPITENITMEQYQKLYDREPVAARVVEVLPKESWSFTPMVYEDEDEDTVTEFEEAWDQLGRDLSGAGYYQTEEGSPVWSYLVNADIQSGIGWYGGVLLGLDDGLELVEPADGIDEKGRKVGSPKGRKLLYLRALGQSCLTVDRYDEDFRSPRFGKPVEYSVTLRTASSQMQFPGVTVGRTMKVHWSRIVHVCEDEVCHVPRMQPVYNRLLDISKVCGGSAEMYYKGAFPGYNLEIDPQILLAGKKIMVSTSDIRDQIEKWQNGLERIMYLQGHKMNSLSTQVVDPTPQLMTYVKMICIELAIPERIFMGSERGELASSQDAGTWNNRMMHRQRTYVTPKIIVPFVDRLIMLGVLPEPNEYFVEWPDLGALTDLEKADLAVKRVDAITKYVGGNGEALVAPMDFLTRVLPYTEEEAQEMLDASMEHQEEVQGEKEEEAQAQADMQAEAIKKAGVQPPAPGQSPIPVPGQAPPKVPGQPPVPPKKPNPFAENAFCPTGEGGGVNPTCSPGEGTEHATTPSGLKIGDMFRVEGETAFREASTIKKLPFGTSVTCKDGKSFMLSHSSKVIVKRDLDEKEKRLAKSLQRESKQSRSEEDTRMKEDDAITKNVFCPTGEGGGINPSCSLEGGASPSPGAARPDTSKMRKLAEGSARRVFEDGDTVIKEAKNRKAKIDNKRELELSGKHPLLAKTIEGAKDGSWVRAEKLAPVTENDIADHYGVSPKDRRRVYEVTIKDPWGGDIKTTGNWMLAATWEAVGKPGEKLGKGPAKFASDLKGLKTAMPKFDLGDLAYAPQWGKAKDGSLKIVDYSQTGT